jgi:RHS repeat-associated protein
MKSITRPPANRVEKGGTGGTDYIYFGGRQLARLSGGQWTDLIYGVRGLLAEVPGTQAGAPVYRMVDHLGSVVGTVNTSGTLLSTLDYAPFGQIFARGTADPYVFTGKERDTESGNDYFGARYYASSMGRWLSPDWSAKYEPVPYAKLDNPQSLNLYGYVLNNPLRHADPDGHQCDTCQKVWNWLTSNHSANAGGSAAVAQSTSSSGGLSATIKLATGTATSSASYGTSTSASAKLSGSAASLTVNEGGNSTTQVDALTANAGAHAGVGADPKSGLGVSAGAGANADVLSGSQTETLKLGPVTITGTATGNVGIGANASYSLGTGVSPLPQVSHRVLEERSH